MPEWPRQGEEPTRTLIEQFEARHPEAMARARAAVQPATAAYVRIGRRDRTIHRTHVISDDLLVDCDEQGYVIGVELLGWTDMQTALWRVLCEAVMPAPMAVSDSVVLAGHPGTSATGIAQHLEDRDSPEDSAYDQL